MCPNDSELSLFFSHLFESSKLLLGVTYRIQSLQNMARNNEDKHKKPVENLGDFMEFGYYSLFFILMYELLILPQVGTSMVGLIFPPVPYLISCFENV